MNLSINQIYNYFDNIGCCVFATINDNFPQTRIAHLRAFDEEGIYFMTMDCKPFYSQLKTTGKVSICGLMANPKVEKAEEYSFEPGYSARLNGEVKEVSMDYIKSKNNPMFALRIADKIKYPAMVIFVIYSASGEIFDYDFEMSNRDFKLLGTKFSFGGAVIDDTSYKIGNNCTKCGSCKRVCSFKAIEKINGKYIIDSNKCDECGNCLKACPLNCITKI